MILKVVEEDVNDRLDKYIESHTDYSRSKALELIKDNKVLVNNKVSKASLKIKYNDVIELPDKIEREIDIKGEDIDIEILYEDEDIIVVNKPSGLVVHPGNGNMEHTLVNALLYHTNSLSSENGDIRPGIVHRIDKDTSGTLLIAKNDKVHKILADGFKNKTIKREYIALLKGEFKSPSATIDAPIGRDKQDRKMMCVTKDNSKEAVTHLKVLKRYKGYTLVSLRLETGRTHQIRVHMKYIGYPVYNDPVYTQDKCSSFGQFLHAKSLEFNHPTSGEKMYFESPLPKEFQEFIDGLVEL